MQQLNSKFPLASKVHKYLLPVLRIAVSLFALAYVSRILYLKWIELPISFYDLLPAPTDYLLLLLVFILMFFNWGIESLKWKLIISSIEAIGWKRIIISVIYGISLGMITPKRMGEMAGRIIYLKPTNRIHGIILFGAGSASQLLVTILTGFTAMAILLYYCSFSVNEIVSFNFNQAVVTAGIAIPTLLLILIILVVPVRKQIYGTTKKLFKPIKTLSYLTGQQWIVIFGLSLLRYSVFVVQYYLLLNAFGLKTPFWISAALIAIIYLIMTIIPFSAILEVGIRGSVALVVFGWYAANTSIINHELPVLAAAIVLWIINLALPALAGSFAALKTEIFPITVMKND
jgi:hypothetical protein